MTKRGTFCELFLLLCVVTAADSRTISRSSGWMGVHRGGASWKDLFGGSSGEKEPPVTTSSRMSNNGNSSSSEPLEPSSRDASTAKQDETNKNEDDEDLVVGVKSHKKSNAVGDPDGSDSDDDDDDDSEFDSSDWEHFEQELLEPQVQVEVELVEEESTPLPSIRPGGGVGLRFGQRLQNHRRQNNNKPRSRQAVQEVQLLDAWEGFVFAPNLAPLDTAQTRMLDGASKVRLDRRTLYAGLSSEWKKGSSERRFLSASTSQALQAALSLATQPSWRQAIPRPSAIRLYDDPDRACTLAMQETIAMALAHSLGAGLVIIDDQVLAQVRQSLLRRGYPEQDTKPAALIQNLMSLGKDGKLRTQAKASISECMKRDLELGLDDPYDERAISSCEEMAEWEAKDGTKEGKAMPLVIFLRASTSTALLKNKAAVELLLEECNSSESTSLLILGKGIDAATTTLPQEPVIQESNNPMEGAPHELPMRNTPGAAPWFGFSPNNQNASGQNDPEGSRRFNIFLARTIDPNGTTGILGAIAPPQAGNLFPHMMALQARDRLEDDSPMKAELERWAQMLQQQMQTNGGMPLPPPQFFNASLSPGEGIPPPPPQVIQETLQQALSELLDRLAQMTDEEDGDATFSGANNLSPDLHKAFAQVLRNENLRRGIAENLARAAPALSDPKCQGVMLSVYVPPQQAFNTNSSNKANSPMGGWFQKILKHQDDPSDANNHRRRTRTMAAAAAVMAAKNAQDNKNENGDKQENRFERNLAKLEAICRPIPVDAPADPVRAKAFKAWIQRERGSVLFRQNRRALNEQLLAHFLALQEHTGTRGAGSSLRQMLSVRNIEDEMEGVVHCAIELEAARSQRQEESPEESHKREEGLEVDITLSQLLATDEDAVAEHEKNMAPVKFIHPSSLESALSMVTRISPSPSGGLSLSGSGPVAHRTRDEISAMAQDKHERALVSQVASPQDIGVTYDMIGGLSDVKELLRQSITYPLKYPHLYSEGIAREAVKGVLLFGPPGTGKTMLAKAVATEGGASFLSVDASSVENKWLGESEKNAKAVFTLARRLAPCVIFIDEVDSLLSSREGSSDDSAHGTLTSVKTTMMSEWDGLNSGTNGSGEAGSDRVVVIGSTNRPFDLDEAVLRRFPRRILVDLPDLETRREILEVTLAENRVDPAVNLTKIAERLDGYTGSDIKEVCREAVVQISHEQAKLLDQGAGNSRTDVTEGSLQRLRPATAEDFDSALSKLKRSVSEKGRELARVWEWNDEYGEMKKEKKNHLPHLANMYL